MSSQLYMGTWLGRSERNGRRTDIPISGPSTPNHTSRSHRHSVPEDPLSQCFLNLFCSCHYKQTDFVNLDIGVFGIGVFGTVYVGDVRFYLIHLHVFTFNLRSIIRFLVHLVPHSQSRLPYACLSPVTCPFPHRNEDMSVYVKKVQFKLHDSYPNATRVVSKPPYEVTETGWGEFEVVIKIYFEDPNERPVRGECFQCGIITSGNWTKAWDTVGPVLCHLHSGGKPESNLF